MFGPIKGRVKFIAQTKSQFKSPFIRCCIYNSVRRRQSLNQRFINSITVCENTYLKPLSTIDTTMTSSQPRQNFAAEVEAGINKQINLELYASYCYLSMAYYFDRDDVALPGFHKFFLRQSDEERDHANKFMKYQNQRGGRIVLQNVSKPSLDDWGSGIDAMQAALHLEKTVNQSLLDLHKLANTHNDPQFSDILENQFLGEQVDSIKQYSDYVTNLKRVGSGLGEYMFDKETLKGATD